MKNQKNRSMKVYSQNGRNYKATPTIILKGQWLEEMGFAIGDYISVSCENGKLVITPDTERAELEQMKADFMEKETTPVITFVGLEIFAIIVVSFTL